MIISTLIVLFIKESHISIKESHIYNIISHLRLRSLSSKMSELQIKNCKSDTVGRNVKLKRSWGQETRQITTCTRVELSVWSISRRYEILVRVKQPSGGRLNLPIGSLGFSQHPIRKLCSRISQSISASK